MTKDDGLLPTLRLVERAQGGDRQALDELFARYLPRVRQIVAFRMGYRLRDFSEHEDVLQDALLKAFEGLDGFEERSEGSFRNWLASCVLSAANDRARRGMALKRGGGKVRQFSQFEGEDLTALVFASDEPTPSAQLRGKELAESIEAAILGLEEHHREVILLRLFCEMPYDEMGRELGIEKEPTVRKLYSRALEKLRAACED